MVFISDALRDLWEGIGLAMRDSDELSIGSLSQRLKATVQEDRPYGCIPIGPVLAGTFAVVNPDTGQAFLISVAEAEFGHVPIPKRSVLTRSEDPDQFSEGRRKGVPI